MVSAKFSGRARGSVISEKKKKTLVLKGFQHRPSLRFSRHVIWYEGDCGALCPGDLLARHCPITKVLRDLHGLAGRDIERMDADMRRALRSEGVRVLARELRGIAEQP